MAGAKLTEGVVIRILFVLFNSISPIFYFSCLLPPLV